MHCHFPGYRTTLAFSIACAMALPVAAQSNVTLYGMADAALTTARPGGAAASVNRLSSGVYRASRLGFEGREDLGGGMAAIFDLEMGLDLGTGELRSYAGAPETGTPAAPGGRSFTGFNRRSFVGLQGAFGTLALGRDYTPMFYAGSVADPFSYGLFGNFQAAAQLSGTGGERFGRASNAVFYTTPQWGPFLGRAMYSFSASTGETPLTPPAGANRMVGVYGQYTLGNWVFAGEYTQTNLPLVAAGAFTGTGKRTDWMVGAKYRSNGYIFSGGYLRVKQPTRNADGSVVVLGGWVPFGASRVGVIAQRLSQQSVAGDKKAMTYGIGYVYSLSKRTELYGSYGLTKNNALGTFNIGSSDYNVAAGGPGASPRALAVGVSHKF